MGDSYSSGEGVEPFEAGTATATDTCHRSKFAYPRVLAKLPGSILNLGSSGFIACSGATTSAITLGYNSEGAQMERLTSTTDLVTITIGGNNVPFDKFATACVMPGLHSGCDGKAYKDAMSGIANSVTPRLEYTLNAMKDRLTNLHSNATVLVIGYPELVPATWVYETKGCWWLQPKELPAIRKVTTALNAAIQKRVEAVSGRFKFVSATAKGSPFIGHELCRSTSDKAKEYFNNYDSSAPTAYTFHPNKDGQIAYAMLITSYLKLHPLS